MHIVHSNSVEEAREYVKQGYCPVECSFGPVSVVDGLEMDHHGALSHLTGVAVRAYAEHFGARRADPRFVVTGWPDFDATFAIAALAGVLPHPSRAKEFESAPAPIRNRYTRDLSALADLINRIDCSPIGIRLSEEVEGPLLLLFNSVVDGTDALGFYSGVAFWRRMTAGQPPAALLAAALAEEVERIRLAREAEVTKVGERVAVVVSKVWGCDIWYAEVAPVIVSFVEQTSSIMLGCPNVQIAERLFGPGGLRNIYPILGDGWGGKADVGGSPRGKAMSRADADVAAEILAASIVK